MLDRLLASDPLHARMRSDIADAEAGFDEDLDLVALEDGVTSVSRARLAIGVESPLVREAPENRAAWAYLAELPPNTRVIPFYAG